MVRPRLTALAALLGLVLAGFGLWLLAAAGDEQYPHQVRVDGVPLEEIHPGGLKPGERRPGVVVAHGFSGSGRLMAPFADSLVARGYVVVLLDFSGHGANTRPLPDDTASSDASRAALDRDLDVALRHLRGLRDVDPARVGLVGHSMGAGAVTRYAAAHPEVGATVALSLPGAGAALTDRPARLLLLVGALEFPGFHEAAATAAEHGGPDRSVRTVPAVEHISILYAPRAHRETADWLDAAFGGPLGAGPVPWPGRRPVAGVLLMLGFALVFPLLARVTLGGVGPAVPRSSNRAALGWTALVGAVTVGVAAVAAAALPAERLPVALGGYFAAFAVLAGALLVGYQRLRGTVRSPYRRARAMVAAPLLVAFAFTAVVVPLNLGVSRVVLAGPRWWLLLVLWGGFAVLAYGTERLAGGVRSGVPVVSALVVVALTGAAVVGLTHGFVLLVVPVIAVLLGWQAVWAAVMRRLAAPAWVIALVGSVLVAFPLATAPPLIG